MKLDTFEKPTLMTDAHDDALIAVLRPGRDTELIGNTLGFDDQRVIAGRFEWLRKVAKNAHPTMLDRRGSAVHDSASTNYTSTEGYSDRLMSEAHAQDWYTTSKALNQGN